MDNPKDENGTEGLTPRFETRRRGAPALRDGLPAQVKYDEGDLSNLFSHLTNSSINKCCRTSAQLAAAPTPAPAPLLARRKLLRPFWHCKQNENARVGVFGALCAHTHMPCLCAREPSRAVRQVLAALRHDEGDDRRGVQVVAPAAAGVLTPASGGIVVAAWLAVCRRVADGALLLFGAAAPFRGAY